MSLVHDFLHNTELNKNLNTETGRRYLFENILLFLLGIYLLIDTVNGLFVITLGLPNVLSAGYKQALFGLMLVFAFQFEPRRFFWCLLITSAIFIWAILRFMLVDNIWFFDAFQEAIKVIYLFVMVLVISSFRQLNQRKLNGILLFSVGIVALNVVFSLSGIGHTTYHSFGAKGFFYAGNAVSGVIVTCAAYMLANTFKHSILRFVLIILFLSGLALLIGTKSGFLGVLVCASLVIMFNFDTRSITYGGLLLLTMVVGWVFYGELLQQQPLFQRAYHFYENGGITRLIFSGRDRKLMEIWPVFQNADLWQILLGLDMPAMLRQGIWRVEFDWADMQINFGIVLSLGVYWGYLILFSQLLTRPGNAVVQAAIIAFMVLIMVSAIAGHVLYNGMVTPLWALLIAAAFNTNIMQELHKKQITN